MSKELAKGELAKGLSYDITLLDGGKADLEMVYEIPGSLAKVKLSVELSAEQIAALAIDGLEKIIPGDQTGIAASLKGALHGAMSADPAA